MRVIKDKLEGPVQVDEDIELYGMITGDVLVVAGGRLDLHGTCCSDLHVESGGFVSLWGTVAGDVVNEGGRIDVYGIIGGQLIELSGVTTIHPGAIISDQSPQ